MHAEQGGEQLNHVLGPDAACHQDRVRLSGTLVQYRQQLQPSPVLRLIHEEIVAPDMVLVLGAPAPAAMLAAAHALPFPLHLGDVKPPEPPEPLHPFSIHALPFPLQERPDPPIPVAGMTPSATSRSLKARSRSRLRPTNRWLDRGWPITRHARRSATPHRRCTCITAARLRVWLRSFPWRPRAGC